MGVQYNTLGVYLMAEDLYAWTVDETRTLSSEKISAVQAAIEKGIVIAEHWHYCGGRAPTRYILEELEDLEKCLKSAIPGDSIWFWELSLLTEGNALIHGKLPDDQGRTPVHGAY